jgi:cell division protein FtsX
MAKAIKKTTEESAMAKNEKHNDGTMTGLKKTIIGTVSTLVVGGGTFLMSYLQKPKESDVKTQPQTQQSININIPQQQQAAGGKTVIIKEKAPADKDVKKAENSEKPKPKKDGDEFKEKPAQW